MRALDILRVFVFIAWIAVFGVLAFIPKSEVKGRILFALEGVALGLSISIIIVQLAQ